MSGGHWHHENAEEKTTTSALAPQESRARFSRLSHRYDRLLWAELATKVAVSIILTENHEPDLLERWFSDSGLDVRHDPAIGEQVVAFLKTHAVRSTVVADGIIGCPHEEGVDYPEGKIVLSALTGRGVIAGPRSESTERIAKKDRDRLPDLPLLRLQQVRAR